MEYIVKVTPDGSGFMVTCPEIPEFVSGGDSAEEALSFAQDAMETALMIYIEDRRAIPMPRRAKKGEIAVRITSQGAAKTMLHNEMLEQGISKAELKRRLDISSSQVERLLDMCHSTKLEALEEAIEAVGKHLELSVA